MKWVSFLVTLAFLRIFWVFSQLFFWILGIIPNSIFLNFQSFFSSELSVLFLIFSNEIKWGPSFFLFLTSFSDVWVLKVPTFVWLCEGRGYPSFPKYQIFPNLYFIPAPPIISHRYWIWMHPPTTKSPTVILGNHYPIKNIILQENQSRCLHLLTKKQMGLPIFLRIEKGAVE